MKQASEVISASTRTTPSRSSWCCPFSPCGALGTLGFGCVLAFEYLASGSPLAFVEAQRGWNRADSVAAVFLARRQPALGLYAALSMGVMLLQGEVANVFRFGTVVFPLLVFLGDRCARRPVWFQGAVVLTLPLLNLATARGYALGRWAY